jgi:hypothetical protein
MQSYVYIVLYYIIYMYNIYETMCQNADDGVLFFFFVFGDCGLRVHASVKSGLLEQ